ncbi:ATP-binding protein [Luteolibacter yonseiensis]|uniref:ATP-binding protein n=1 Tax=Luteolibacter yonseiensis TaxID=1144680 RepID=A0A934R2M9_9BACT|nr:AAA family ATPase [Luteolibacter yonseiensis]MBK1815729.1 ATP-binding protein [Luteolibacter yonseiensis]
MAQYKEKMILSPQQQHALKKLLPVARIATSGIRSGMSVLPRTHSLLIGPSGSGKSHLARRLGEQLGIPSLVINVAAWMIAGSRGDPWTISLIADWLDRLPGAGVLVLDEIDKLQSPSEWTRNVRLEIHDLLDGVLPVATKLPIESLPAESFPQGSGKDQKAELERTLRERVMIMGCGAWQSAWRGNARTLGFNSSKELFLPEPPTKEQILAEIDAELRQRFRDEIVLLSPMLPADYAHVAKDIARQIPQELIPAWNKEIGGVLRRAADGFLGMRAIEELLLKAMLLAGKGKEPDKSPEPQSLKPPRPEPSIW